MSHARNLYEAMEALREKQRQYLLQQNLRFVAQQQQLREQQQKFWQDQRQQLDRLHQRMLELLKAVVDEVSNGDGCAEQHPLADAHQVFDKSPKRNAQIKPGELVGEGQEKLLEGSEVVADEPLDVSDIRLEQANLEHLGKSTTKSSLGMVLEDVAITQLSSEVEFSRAVEQKQVAQQEAERSKYVVMKAEQEKRATIIRAAGESEAARLYCSKWKTLKLYENHGWKWTKSFSFIVFDPGKLRSPLYDRGCVIMVEPLGVIDPGIADIIELEEARQWKGLELIPFENFTSVSVMPAMGSVMTNKYREGYPAAVLVAVDVDEALITMDSPEDDSPSANYIEHITIPSAFIDWSFGDTLKKALNKGNMVDARVEYELWKTSRNEGGVKCAMLQGFVKEFTGAAQILEKGGYTQFTPHYITWSCTQAFTVSLEDKALKEGARHGTQPRVEAAMVHARIRKAVRSNFAKVGYIRPASEFNYNCEHLGTGPPTLLEIAGGCHPLSSAINNSEYPAIIVGDVGGQSNGASFGALFGSALQFGIIFRRTVYYEAVKYEKDRNAGFLSPSLERYWLLSYKSKLKKDELYCNRLWRWNGHLIQYTVVGDDGPAVLLVHGFGAFHGHYPDNLCSIAEDGKRVWAITPPATDFVSSVGKKLFIEAVQNGTMEGFYKLLFHLQTQSKPAYSGLTSLSIVLNELAMDPGRTLKGPWRWFDESMLDCCEPLEKVKAKGISAGKIACLAHCGGAVVQTFRTNESSTNAFRNYVNACPQVEDVHVGRDMALILGVAWFKYQPHWVPLTLLREAMDAIDEASGEHRGYMLIFRREQEAALLFTLSSKHPSWESVAKYLIEDIPSLLKSPSMRDVEEVIDVVCMSLPSNFRDFIKWVAEVRRTVDNGESVSKDEISRLMLKEDLLKQVQEIGLYNYVTKFLSSAYTCARKAAKLGAEETLSDAAAADVHTIHKLEAVSAVFDPEKLVVLRMTIAASSWSGAGIFLKHTLILSLEDKALEEGALIQGFPFLL